MSKLKPVEVQYFDRVPKWLVLQSEIDLRIFLFEQMYKDDLKKPPIHTMIDQATGFDKQLYKEAEELIAEIRWLKQEYEEAQP